MNYVKIQKPELDKPLKPLNRTFDVDWYLSDERTAPELFIFDKDKMRWHLQDFFETTLDQNICLNEWYDQLGMDFQPEADYAMQAFTACHLNFLKDERALFCGLPGAPFDVVREDFLPLVDKVIKFGKNHPGNTTITLQLHDGTNIEAFTFAQSIFLSCLIDEILTSKLLQNLKGAHEALVENIESHLKEKENEELEWMRAQA